MKSKRDSAMDQEIWRRVEELFHAALERAPETREAFFDDACKEDAKLRQQVELLLRNGEEAGSFLEQPALETTPTLTAAGSLLGRQFGHYCILSPLGAGGMGEVYRAHDSKLGRDVAIKTLPVEFARDPERLVRFRREARTLASLNHPNIAAIHGLEESGDVDCLVLELVEGETLADRLKKGPLLIELVLRYGAEIADALAAAHARGIVHRDLKPANIMVTKTGVKILDFGLAKVAPASAGESLTQTSAIMGTPAYMAPEQTEGKECDARTDIYALGLMLREMTIGRRDGTTTGLPQHLAHVIDRCLAEEPEDRWQTARDLKAELEWAPPDAERVVSAPRHSRVPWVVAAALAVGLLGVSLVAWRATRPVDRPLMRFSTDLGPEALEGSSITAAISPDGMQLAFVARGPSGKHQLATRLLDQATAALLAGTENASDPFFSPDGQWIGFFADGKMKKIFVQGGAAVTLCDAPGARGASWGEDGSIIVGLIANGGLSRVPAAGGTPQTLTRPGEKGEFSHRWPQILPGTQAVLFTSGSITGAYEDGSIAVLSLNSGQWKTVQSGGYFGRYLPTGYLAYVHQGTLFAVRFDLDRLEVRGTPVPVLEDVAANSATGEGQYNVARNGTLVYLSGRSSTEGWGVEWRDGTGKPQPLLAAPGQYYTPRFSPDGRRLALAVGSAGGPHIQVYDWQRDTMTRLTFTQRNVYPVWAPDGKHIAFGARSPDAKSLQWIRADGAGEAELLLERKDLVGAYSFSPDGKRLAFGERGVDTSFDIWTLPLDLSDPEHPKPGKPELFLRTPFDEQEPAFSPDGRWIAYRSNESGRNEVYVRPFSSGTPSRSGKWQISTGGGAHPIWSRDGRELFYQSLDNRIMVSNYTANANSFAADKPRAWSDTRIREPGGTALWNLDLAPDGKRFAVFPIPESTGEQKGSVHVTVLLNFFDELRRRVPASK